MTITSNLSGTIEAAVLVPFFRNALRFCALLPAFTLLAVHASAWADVYRWTDAKGGTVISDALPKTGETVRNFQVVTQNANPADSTASAATPKNASALDRAKALERQQQVKRLLASVRVFPPPAADSGYYPLPRPPSAPPAVIYLDNGYYDSGYYDSGYYPSYYPSYYPALPSYSYGVVTSRAYVSRPAFAVPRGAAFRGGGGAAFHGGGGGGSFRGGGGSSRGGGGHGGRR